MSSVLNYVLLAILLLAVVHFMLPREPRLHVARGRLAVRPPPARVLGDSTMTLLMLLGSLYLFVRLLFADVLLGAALVGLVLLRLTWLAWRRWQRTGVVFDRRADSIRHGRVQIGSASHAVGVRVTGVRAPALELFLRDAGGATTAWPVPNVEQRHAATVGRAIADYLQVPMVTALA